jgi:hypothetical protein
MGEFAETVQDYICEALSESYHTGIWETEFTINGTPVDIGGSYDNHLYLFELEWRRADPSDNAAKIFRHLQTDEIANEHITLFHIFTDYYELSRGGVSSKRENAEFIGETAAQAHEKLSYYPIDFDMDPPKRGEEWPDIWKETADRTVAALCNKIEMKNSS